MGSSCRRRPGLQETVRAAVVKDPIHHPLGVERPEQASDAERNPLVPGIPLTCRGAEYIEGPHWIRHLNPVRPLNILCSSTRQWNPGDEWIALGIRRLFRTLYPERVVNWILYDRSPDCFLEPWAASARRPHLLGNSYQPGEELPAVDLVVIAGTPEWLGPQLEPLARIRHTSGAPVFYLGIDYPSTELPCSPGDLRMLSGALLVTRGGLATQALQT